MDGLHSPWGIIGKIKDTRGWTNEQVLWGESWINIVLENADQARHVKRQTSAPVVETKEDLDRVLGRRGSEQSQ